MGLRRFSAWPLETLSPSLPLPTYTHITERRVSSINVFETGLVRPSFFAIPPSSLLVLHLNGPWQSLLHVAFRPRDI